jgi:hypothetical protein
MGRPRKTPEETLAAHERKLQRDWERQQAQRAAKKLEDTAAGKLPRKPGVPRDEWAERLDWLLWVCYLGGQSIKDQAAKLGVKPNTHSQHMRRTMKRKRSRM